MSSTQTGQRAPGWEVQPAAPPNGDQRLLITPAARAVFAANGQAPPAASHDGGVIRRADAAKQLSGPADPTRGERQANTTTHDASETASRGRSPARATSAEESAAPTLGALSSSVDVCMGAATDWSLAGLLSVCVRELSSVGQGSIDATVRRGEDLTSSSRGVRLQRAEQLVAAQIERALERGTDVHVGASTGEESEATPTLSLLVVDASRLGVDELITTTDGVGVAVGTPQRKVVPVDVGEGEVGVGIRVVMRFSVTVGPDAPSSVLRGLIENVSGYLADDRWEAAT